MQRYILSFRPAARLIGQVHRTRAQGTTTGRANSHSDHPLSTPWKSDRVPLTPGLLGAAGLLPLIFFASEHQPFGDNGKDCLLLSTLNVICPNESTPARAFLHTAPPRWDAAVARAASVVGVSSFPVLTAGSQARVRHRFQTYAASILSFLGAVHWGLAMAAPVHHPGRYVAAVVPSLVAWGAVNAPGAWGHAEGDPNSVLPYYALGAGFVGSYLYDETLASVRAVPRWYSALRAPLTFAVLGLVVGSMFAIREPRTRRAV